MIEKTTAGVVGYRGWEGDKGDRDDYTWGRWVQGVGERIQGIQLTTTGGIGCGREDTKDGDENSRG